MGDAKSREAINGDDISHVSTRGDEESRASMLGDDESHVTIVGDDDCHVTSLGDDAPRTMIFGEPSTTANRPSPAQTGMMPLCSSAPSSSACVQTSTNSVTIDEEH